MAGTLAQSRSKVRKSMAMATAVAASLGYAHAARAQAQTWTWNNFAGQNNWNVGSNWLENTVPVSGSNTVVVFGGTGADSYTAVQNIANPFLLNKMNITSSATGPVNIGNSATNAANTLRFAGAGAAVNHTGSGDVTLYSPLQHAAADVNYNITGTGKLIIMGNMAQSGGTFGLTKTGTGVLQWGGAERGIGNSIAGDINILEGSIVLGNSAGSFLSNNALITIAPGATFDFANNAEDMGSLQGGGTLRVQNVNVNLGLDNASTTWSGNIDGTTAGTNHISKEGTGTWTITSPQSYNHRTQVDGGTIVFSGEGSARNTSLVIVNAGNSMVLDSSGTNNTDRLNDAAGANLFGNSSLTLVGNNAAATTESIGNVGISGLVTLTVQPGTGQNAAITATSLTRNAGATALFRGPNLGATPGPDTANVFFSFTPALTGGGGAAGTPSISILHYALGDTSPTGAGSTLVTYDPVTGVRPLDINTEFAPYETAQPTDNAKITAASSNLAGKRVNSLLVQNSGAAPMEVSGAAADTLFVDGGALLFTGSAPINFGGFGQIAFDFGEGIFSVANSAPEGVTISSPIFNGSGITKGGAGLLVLSANNLYFGNTVINAGTLRVASDANLGDPSAGLVFNVGTLQAGGDLTSARSLTVTTGGVATFDTNGHTITLSGTLAGAGTLVKKGQGTLALDGTATYTRGTNIDQGVLQIASASSIGTGNITFNGGTLRAKAGASPIEMTNRAIVLGLSPDNTIDTNGTDMTVGAMSGPGGLTKVGAGVLNVNSANSFQGDLFIKEGTVRPPSGAGSWLSDVTYVDVAAGATLDVNDNAEQVGGISGAGTINLGVNGGVDIHVLGNRDSTFTGVIQGAGFLRKNGPHTLTLSGPSTFTGRTEVWAGKLVINDDVLPNQPGPLGQSSVPIMLGRNSLADESNLIMGQSGVEIGRIISLVSGGTGVSRLGSSHTTGTSTISGGIELFKPVEITAETGGTLDITGVISGTEGVTKVGGGTVRFSAANTYAGPTTVRQGNLEIGQSQRMQALTIEDAGAARLLPGSGGPQAPKVLTVSSLLITPTGKLDVADGGLVVDYTAGGISPADPIRSAIITGRAGGAWNGDRISSSTAAAISGRAVGYAEAGDVLGPTGGDFMGQTVDGDAVLVRHTILGDADLNGSVAFGDLVRLAQNYNTTDGTGVWARGDFDYDGNVGFSDLVALAQNYNSSIAPAQLAMFDAGFQEDLAAAFAQVPEPGALTLMAIGGWVSLRRHRRAR